MYFERPLVRAYVDETGDRGLSSRSSRYFGMVAVVLADEDDAGMRHAIAECRRRLSVPANKPLHWTEHVKRYPRRQFVASVDSRLITCWRSGRRSDTPTGSKGSCSPARWRRTRGGRRTGCDGNEAFDGPERRTWQAGLTADLAFSPRPSKASCARE
jgi:hypothetical protein